MDGWAAKRIDALVNAAQEASQRSRWYFTALFLSSMLLFSAQIGLYAPWAAFVKDRAYADCIKRDGKEEELCHDDLRQLSRVIWVELYNVNIPILGVKVNSDDLVILGPLAISALAVLCWYAFRREHHVIVTLCGLASDNSDACAKQAYIYDAIVHHFVLSPSTDYDGVLYEKKRNKITRAYLRFMEWFPTVTCALSVTALVAIYCLPPDVLENIISTALIPGSGGGVSLWSRSVTTDGSNVERYHFVIRVLVGTILTGVVAAASYSGHKYIDATTNILANLRELAEKGGAKFDSKL